MSTDMLATIDDITAAKVDRDRKIHGRSYLCVDAEGKIAHVPIDCVGPRLSEALEKRAMETMRALQERK